MAPTHRRVVVVATAFCSCMCSGHLPQPAIIFVTIKGERHHGTNWVRQMINTGCPTTRFALNTTCDSDGAWGWKHGMFTFATPPPNVIPLVIYRSVETWLPRMARETYEAMGRKGTVPIMSLLEAPFPCSRTLDTLCPVAGTYPSAVDMLRAKYDAWASIPGIHLCYDTLARMGPAHLANALKTHGVRCSVAKMKRVGYASNVRTKAGVPRDLTHAEWAHMTRHHKTSVASSPCHASA